MDKVTRDKVQRWRDIGNSLIAGDSIKIDSGDIYTVADVSWGGLRIDVTKSPVIFVHPMRIISINGLVVRK